MTRVLFVTNGHGEIAIADRLAGELHAVAPQIASDHLALVGDVPARNARDVGPRRRMPSGGIVAMGNVRNIARDVAAGLPQLTLAQITALRRARARYAAVVAVGDAYALAMALIVRSPVVYVGTAKSVLVAPYGRVERALLRRARARFVRDAATAASLERDGVRAEAPGNVIVDLYATGDPAELNAAARDFERVVAVLPGSRDAAYADAAFLADVVARAARARADTGGVLSIAPGLDAGLMARALRDRYDVEILDDPRVPFAVVDGERTVLRAWTGQIGPLLQRSIVALGQAGTANEAAAAAGLPVLAVIEGSGRAHGWYRRRQTKLLGEALVALAPDAVQAAQQLGELIDDPGERRRRGEVGKERMGPAGGARRIATRIAEIACSPEAA
jgi:uncharacterized protein (TIGR03492 family)